MERLVISVSEEELKKGIEEDGALILNYIEKTEYSVSKVI